MRRAILLHELKSVVGRRSSVLLFVAVLLLCGLTVANGQRWWAARVAAIEAFESEQATAMEAFRSQLQAIEAGDEAPSPYDGNPMSLKFAATLPPGPLAQLAAGQSELQPATGLLSPWRNDDSMFGNYEFENPDVLAFGRVDYAFLILFLAPLLAIGFSFDALASDRQRGTLTMILVGPVSVPELVWTRLWVRHAAVWSVFMLPAAAALFLPGATVAERLPRLLIWGAAVLVYAGFWLALSGLCVARIRDARATAAVLVGLWAIFTLGAPAAASAAEAFYPPPSRLAYLAEMRAAQGEANREIDRLTEGYLLDHPELSVSDEAVPAYYRGAFLANVESRARTAPLVEAYAQSAAARRRLVSAAQYLAPPLLIRRVLHVAAGADLERERAFQAEARQALHRLSDAVGPAVMARQRMTVTEVDALERFAFSNRSPQQVAGLAALPLGVLAGIAMLLAFLAQGGLRRPSVVLGQTGSEVLQQPAVEQPAV